MKPSVFVVVTLVLAACDAGPRIVVQASLGGEPVADLPVMLLPYDRDRLRDSLRREAGDDAPAVPQELAQELSALDSALARPVGDSVAMRRADSLRTVRGALAARLDSSRMRVAEWEARLVRRADSLGLAAAERAERTRSADTTDTAGRAALAASTGQSWIHASYVLTDAVMEWNVPATLPAGQDSTVVQLTERNGVRRTQSRAGQAPPEPPDQR